LIMQQLNKSLGEMTGRGEDFSYSKTQRKQDKA